MECEKDLPSMLKVAPAPESLRPDTSIFYHPSK